MQLNKEQVQTILDNAPAGADKKRILDNLVLKGYDLEGVDSNIVKQSLQQPTQEKSTLLDRVSSNIKEKGQNVQEAISGTGQYEDKSVIERGVGATAQGFSAISGTVYNSLPEVARNTLDKIGGGIGKGINYLADKISNNPKLQEAVSNPEFTKNLESALKITSDLGLISGEIAGAKAITGAGNKVTNISSKIGEKIKTGVERVLPTESEPLAGTGLSKVAEMVKTGAGKTIEEAPAKIMNKVSRVSPKEAQVFKKITGKTVGEYLTEKGNFNSPEKIIRTEAETFARTLADKEATLSKLKGNFKSGIIDDVLDELKNKAESTSTKNVKAPYYDKVNKLIEKSKSTGLSMEEINDVKKLFEREVKLGYNKITDSTKIKQATYLDDALREFQDKTASKLGFTNIKELSNQIQASKFLVDKLGDKIVGQSGLNGVSLTDYVILAGGDPTAIGSFLTKKFFSNKAIQAKIAKMLSKGEVKAPVKSNYSDQATKAIKTKTIKNKNISK